MAGHAGDGAVGHSLKALVLAAAGGGQTLSALNINSVIERGIYEGPTVWE